MTGTADTGLSRLKPVGLVSVLVVGALVSVGVVGASFRGDTVNPNSSFAASPDFVAPTVTGSVISEALDGATYFSEVLADSPLGYWRLGESSGTTANDSSGNGRTGSYADTYTLGQLGAINGTDTATSFTLGSVTINSATLQPNTAVTVEAWVKPTASCGDCAIFDKSANGGTNSSFLMWLTSTTLKCRFIQGGSQRNIQFNGLTTGVWNHVACAWDGSTVRMYINGVQKATLSMTGTIDTGTAMSRIGRLTNNNYAMNGVIDEVAVYGTGLSGQRIASHYAAASGDFVGGASQCNFFYTYASLTDSGNPASGVASVTGDVSAIGSGGGAVPLVSGSYTLEGVAYTHRSNGMVADAAVGSYTYALTSTDNAANTRVQSGYPAAVVAQTSAVSAVFLTGLEQGVASTTYPGVFDTVTGAGISADASVKRHGSFSLRVAPNNAAANTVVQLGGGTTTVVRFAVRLETIPSGTVNLFSVVPAAGNTADLVYDAASGRLGVRWGTGTITTGPVPVAGTWHVVEMSVALDSHTIVWRVDGLTGTPTTSVEAATTAASLRFGTTATDVVYTANFDDIIVSATAADYPIGDGKVLSLIPDGQGTHVRADRFRNDDNTNIDATSPARVDDVPADSTLDYVKQTASNNASWVELTLSDTTATCINAVAARVAFHSASTSGSNVANTRVLDGATASVVYTGNMVVAGQLGFRRVMVTPAAGVWTTAAVNGLVAQIGRASDISPIPYWDSVMLEYDSPGG